MALIPYLLNDLLPSRSNLLSDDLLSDVIDRATTTGLVRRYLQPIRNLAAVAQDVVSTIQSDKDKFQVNLDVQHFAPEDISVKTSDGYVVIEAKHEEKRDAQGYVSRYFKRRYALPEGCNPDTVESKLSSDGVLTVVAPLASENKKDKVVPITHTGPVRRRKLQEDEEINGNAEVEDKAKTDSPKQKRKK